MARKSQVVADAPVENKKSRKSTKTKAQAPAVEAEKKATKTPAAKDEYGTRVGTEANKINIAVTALFDDGPFTVKDLCEKTGYSTSRIRNHLQWLKSRDFIKKTEKGYEQKKSA